MIVVIPSARTVTLSYLAPLIEHGARFIVVDDTEGSITIDHPQFEVYNWRDRKKLLGPYETAIPRGNGACRNLGFYIAWKEGEDQEIIVALDDDCVIESSAFVEQIESTLSATERPVASGLGRHFNTFDLFQNSELRSLFPRGFPYATRVAYKPWTFEKTTFGEVLFNVGLWRGVLDINAVDRVTLQSTNFPDARLDSERSVIVPPGVLISVCSGNMHFRRAVIPAIYQLPMNVEIMPGWTIDRFGDIWGGFVLKRLMDLRGEYMSVGGPMVHHLRAGSTEVNMKKEHLAHLVNEEFIDRLDQISINIEPTNYLEMMAQVREEFCRVASDTTPILRAYLQQLDQSLRAWLGALHL